MSQKPITAFFNRKRKPDNEDDENTRKNVPSSADIECEDSDLPSTSSRPKAKAQKLASKFNRNWMDGRPWLFYVNGEGMYCEYCQRCNKKNPYNHEVWNTKPSVRIRLTSVKDHEQSTEHKDSEMVIVARKVCFQKKELDFSLVNTALLGTTSSLKEKKEKVMKEKVEKVIESMKAVDVEIKLGNKTLDENVRVFEQGTKKPFIDQLLLNLEARFTNTDVMAAFTMLFHTATYQQPDPLSNLKGIL